MVAEEVLQSRVRRLAVAGDLSIFRVISELLKQIDMSVTTFYKRVIKIGLFSAVIISMSSCSDEELSLTGYIAQIIAAVGALATALVAILALKKENKELRELVSNFARHLMFVEHDFRSNVFPMFEVSDVAMSKGGDKSIEVSLKNIGGDCNFKSVHISCSDEADPAIMRDVNVVPRDRSALVKSFEIIALNITSRSLDDNLLPVELEIWFSMRGKQIDYVQTIGINEDYTVTQNGTNIPKV